MSETIRQGFKEEGVDVSISKLCRWSGVPRRTLYYKPTRSTLKGQERFAAPIVKREVNVSQSAAVYATEF